MANLSQSPARHINNFDFLRLFFAILVIFSHSYSLGVGSEANEPFIRMTHRQVSGGNIAVGFFFIMSGYLIAGSLERSLNMREYIAKRIRRIYPGFIVSMLVGLFVVLPFSGGVLAGENFIGKLFNVVANASMLQEFRYIGVFRHNPNPGVINGAVWTIRYEFYCYLGLAVLGLAGLLSRRRLAAVVFFAAIAYSVAFQIWPPDVKPDLIYSFIGFPDAWARLIPLYLAGTVSYLWRDRIRLTSGGILSCAVLLVAACFVPFAWGVVFPFAGAYLLMWIAFNPSIRLSGVARFGDLSYGTYLYAFPLQQAIVGIRGGQMNPWVLFGLSTPLALLFASASWHLVEKPFLQHGRERGTLRQASPTRSQYSAGPAALPSP